MNSRMVLVQRRTEIILPLCLALIWVVAAFVQGVTISAPVLSAPAGGSVRIPLQAAGAQDIGAMHIELVYDPGVISFKTVQAGNMAQNALIDAGADSPGRLVISLATLESLQGDGEIVVAEFQVVGQQGQRSPLTIENTTAWEGQSRHEVLVVTQAGELTVGGFGLSSLPIPLLLALCALLMAGLFAILLFFFLRRRRRPAPVAAPPPAGQVIYCNNCGQPNQPNARFCHACGRPLAANPPQ